MPTFTLGQAAYVNKGAYSSSTSYAALNTVFYRGGTWVALTSVSGVTPGSDSSKWLCITQGIRTVNVTQSGGNATVKITLTDGTTASATVPLATVGDGTITVDKLASSFVLPMEKGGLGATRAEAGRANLGAQKTINKATGTLTVAGWSSSTKKQTLSVTGMTAESEFIASPSNKAGWDAALDATVYPPTAKANGLEFEVETIPTAAIPITVYWW